MHRSIVSCNNGRERDILSGSKGGGQTAASPNSVAMDPIVSPIKTPLNRVQKTKTSTSSVLLKIR